MNKTNCVSVVTKQMTDAPKPRLALILVILLQLLPVLPSFEMAQPKPSVEQSGDTPDALYYGGILSEFISLSANDSDVTSTAKFAVDFIIRRHPKSIPRNERGDARHWQVLDPKKLKLQYTKDGIHPFFYEEISQGLYGPQHQRRQAILGITYTFTLAWPSVPNSFHHKFIINKDREKKLFVYSHYFYKPMARVSVGSILEQLTTPLMGGADSLEVTVPRSILAREGSCTDQSECSTQLADVETANVDQSKSEASVPRQSECEDSGHNIWTEAEKDQHSKTEDSECTGGNSTFARFMTYNVWNFNSMYPGHKKFYTHRMNQMGKLVASVDSDIIAMQELRYDHEYSSEPSPCQVAQFADHLSNYQFVYQPAMTYWQGHLGRVEEGPAIFSKHPIISHDFILLSRNRSNPEDDSHQRICLHAEIENPVLGIVHVFVSHFSLSKTARERSVVEIWRYMQQFSGVAVLLGDLNAEQHESSMKFLRGEIELRGHRTEGLVDAWRVFNEEPRPDAPGTYKDEEVRDPGLTFSALDKHLRKRIDYIYVRLTADTKLLDVSLVDDGLRAHQAASDHIGVSAVIVPTVQS